MSAEIIQFVPKPNPRRHGIVGGYGLRADYCGPQESNVISEASIGGPLAENLQLIGEPKEPA